MTGHAYNHVHAHSVIRVIFIKTSFVILFSQSKSQWYTSIIIMSITLVIGIGSQPVLLNNHDVFFGNNQYHVVFISFKR